MSGKVEAVWLKTTVDYAYDSLRCNKREDICELVPEETTRSFTSLKVEDSQSEWSLAVEAHLKRVREFVQARAGFDAPRRVDWMRTEVCASVDNGNKLAGIFPVNDTECRQIMEGSVVPEEAVVAALFRGAQETVALLGPAQSDAATVISEATVEPVKGGTQAVPGSSPQKAPVVWPKNVPYDATDPKSRPPARWETRMEP